MDLKKYIRDISDFPKEGVVFKDITPLLGNAEALKVCVDRLQALYNSGQKVDKVIGIEARGFILGGMLAERFNAGFIPVRKKGKLPYKVKSKAYSLEYGADELEIHEDAIQPGDRVLIHDDVLATGGTAKAVCELVEELGGVVVQCNFIIELDFLNGREQLKKPVASLFNF
ncbi:adenine phosphoribosyltransferase [Aquimarina intermedia]|uniref:Adenine phosphoribosyltransferase n=1 Tax=Aquimarina intermedia TaxID=350814 RepID=A0A5S5C585_9FLAO|nr:adenine phosphoribosyltransferase [Aquimarina intermedia]TYP73566.1 adenine phosphoribosyltransferase [Aquimarina intermedia]